MFQMRMYRILLILFVFITLQNSLSAQELTQTIQGTVVDKFTQTTLPGVNVIILNTNPIKGTSTNENGAFRIDDIPIGLYDIKFSYIGYKDYVLNQVRLTSGKALTLEVKMEESTEEISEVAVKAFSKKDEPINDRALTGARSFSLEETNKYAGSYGDPARMALNYAGVLPVRDNRNDIIIRGNSSIGLMWRIDGVEIPNPNHFGASGTTGGPVTIINTNLLSNSDFYNSAFPAEYGNAVAGVFDLKMKSGNTQSWEKWIQLGWNGLEFGMEGPVKKGGLASYIVAYRYSFVDILDKIGIPLDETAAYQDLSFKFNFPRSKTGSWSLIGIGGKSSIGVYESLLPDKERSFENYGEDIDNSSSMGVVALTNKISINKDARLVTSISASGNTVGNDVFMYVEDGQEDLFAWASDSVHRILYSHEDTRESKLTFSSNYHYKFSAKSNLSSGFSYNYYILSYLDKQYKNGNYINYTNTHNGTLNLIHAYVDNKRNIGARTELYFGLHAQFLTDNGSWSVEPRGSIKWQLTDNSNISYGIGLHSQMQPKMNYFVQTEVAPGEYVLTNSDLGFTKSLHNTLGYNYLITPNIRLKADVYYQYLYDVPVQTSQPEYSLLNFGTEYYVERKDSLVNKGTGENYGVELTLERFLNKRYFYLLTVSLFESNYTSIDNVKRSTAYNGRYAINGLIGYERPFPKRNVSMVLGLNLTYAGGSPYVPFDGAASLAAGETVYDWDNAYNVNRPNYKRASLRWGVKRNRKKYSMESAIDLQYRTSYTSIYLERVDITTGEIVNTNKMGFYPMANLRIDF